MPIWVKCSERLPKDRQCYPVRWLEDGQVTIINACIFNMWSNNQFDVSDDDDEDPRFPRSTQPDEWLDDETPTVDNDSYWKRRCEAAEHVIEVSGVIKCGAYDIWQQLVKSQP